ncbi:hypothetical protein J3L18_00480 [Mucilaginibacter gossypii]|uniref:hypothetical protein n=1 Tax=Mucilaginibacter gossypii TaxID=551996 RepID=UPI00167B21F8|nr:MULTISPECIES: hypothetical protein [Mucilaginibacter]QTE37577.1 hypothetical protein J3L18_00480 [Mucilaginibacter gossypii]
MKNHDKTSLPKIQIKQIQVLNKALTANMIKGNFPGVFNHANGTTTDTMTSVPTGF